jgi:hypothetical protein
MKQSFNKQSFKKQSFKKQSFKKRFENELKKISKGPSKPKRRKKYTKVIERIEGG